MQTRKRNNMAEVNYIYWLLHFVEKLIYTLIQQSTANISRKSFSLERYVYCCDHQLHSNFLAFWPNFTAHPSLISSSYWNWHQIYLWLLYECLDVEMSQWYSTPTVQIFTCTVCQLGIVWRKMHLRNWKNSISSAVSMIVHEMCIHKHWAQTERKRIYYCILLQLIIISFISFKYWLKRKSRSYSIGVNKNTIFQWYDPFYDFLLAGWYLIVIKESW